MRAPFWLFVLVMGLAIPRPSVGCSVAGCVGNGVEMRRDFAVKVSHDGRPLQGVSVWVTRTTGGETSNVPPLVTASDGLVRVRDLPPGEYWLSTDLLGISAGIQCFQVKAHSTRKARKALNYDWGDLSPATKLIAGKLITSGPGQGGTPLWNELHRVELPIADAKFKLEDPVSRSAFNTQSDANGHFEFGAVPEGIYVLHVSGGKTVDGHYYDSADLLIRASASAKGRSLVLTQRNAGGGSCGGVALEVRDEQVRATN